jgi:hypothetical protein
MRRDPILSIFLGSEFPEMVDGAAGPRYPDAPNRPFLYRRQKCETVPHEPSIRSSVGLTSFQVRTVDNQLLSKDEARRIAVNKSGLLDRSGNQAEIVPETSLGKTGTPVQPEAYTRAPPQGEVMTTDGFALAPQTRACGDFGLAGGFAVLTCLACR